PGTERRAGGEVDRRSERQDEALGGLMVRTLILGLLLLAAARGAAADEAATAPSTPVAAASAPATTRSVDATKQGKAAPAAAASQAAQPGGDVKMSGISILGNEDAPKSLVLVPWKSSQLADMPGVARLLDSATQPVDKDVCL